MEYRSRGEICSLYVVRRNLLARETGSPFLVRSTGNGTGLLDYHVRDFPNRGPSRDILQGLLLCRYPNCGQCFHSAESSSVHFDCLKVCLLTAGYGTLACITTLATWRRPWRQAPDLYLRNRHPLALPPPALDLSGYQSELLRMIQSYIPSNILWRLNQAQDFAARVTSETTRSRVCLGEISKWARGSSPEFVVDKDSLDVLVTADADGIRKIKRLSRVPSPEEGEFRYAIIKRDQLRKYFVDFKVGCSMYFRSPGC